MCHRSSAVARHARSSALRWAGVVSCLLASPVVLAEETPSLLDDSFYAALGTFILNSDTKVRLDGDTQSGTNLDWENTFGDEDMTRFRLDGYWRFGDSQKHKVRVMWFSTSRDDSRTTDREIEWGGVTYPANVRIDSEFGFDVYELAYDYAFLRRENYEVSGTFGVHYTDLSMKLVGEGSIDGESVAGQVKKEASVGAPLPVIGVRGLWALPHDFWIEASAQYFALSIDEYDGSLQDYRAVVIWQPKKWLGVGVGFNQFQVDVDVDADRFKGSLDWTYSGPMIFYSASF